MDGQVSPKGLGVFILLFGIASPFIIAPYLIRKFYPKQNKKKHTQGWASLIVCLSIFHAIGSYNSKDGITNMDKALYLFNLCMVVTLLSMKFKEPKNIESLQKVNEN